MDKHQIKHKLLEEKYRASKKFKIYDKNRFKYYDGEFWHLIHQGHEIFIGMYVVSCSLTRWYGKYLNTDKWVYVDNNEIVSLQKFLGKTGDKDKLAILSDVSLESSLTDCANYYSRVFIPIEHKPSTAICIWRDSGYIIGKT